MPVWELTPKDRQLCIDVARSYEFIVGVQACRFMHERLYHAMMRLLNVREGTLIRDDALTHIAFLIVHLVHCITKHNTRRLIANTSRRSRARFTTQACQILDRDFPREQYTLDRHRYHTTIQLHNGSRLLIYDAL